MVGAELLQLSSPRFEGGKPGFDAIEVGRIVDRGIRESKYIDFGKLCIKDGEKVWTVFIDIYSINDDGNILDAAGIGAIAALKDARIPKYDEKEEKVVYGEWTTKKIPLQKDAPLPITFHKIGNRFLIDPTKEEEDIREARITIGSSDGIISSMQKGDEKEISIEELNEVLDVVEKIWKDLNSKIDKNLK